MDFQTFKNEILSLLFPKRCPYCGKVILPKENLCDSCKTDLPIIQNPRCPFCGESKKDCVCNHKKSYYNSVIAPFYYENQIRIAIHRLKFESKDFLADTFAKDMALAVQENLNVADLDVIAFIPFTKKQQRERIYNPSQILAEALSEILSIPIEPLLIKLFETKTQHSLKSEERSGNVLGAYDVLSAEKVKNKSILLVDDIKTTGSTLNECAKMLMLHDAKQVVACTFAVTKQRKKEK